MTCMHTDIHTHIKCSKFLKVMHCHSLSATVSVSNPSRLKESNIPVILLMWDKETGFRLSLFIWLDVYPLYLYKTKHFMNFIMVTQIENVMAGNQVKHSDSHVCALHTHFLFYSNIILIVVIMGNNYDMWLSILSIRSLKQEFHPTKRYA